MRIYRAFGLTISSDIELPQLKPASNEEPNVKIRLADVTKTGLTSPIVTKVNSQSAPNEFWFHAPKIAWFYIFEGNTIHVMPEPGADMQSVRLYILGTCIGALMHQRNQLTIHGNAIKVNGGCIILAGHSGNGKSTLAMAFLKKGYQLLSDDLAVVDDNNFVQPSYPQTKIWQHTADLLDIDTSQLKRIRYHINKFAYPLDKNHFCQTPQPLKAMYILSSHNQENVEFTPIYGAEKFFPLKNQTYRLGQLKGLGLKPKHLNLCSNIANSVKITRITRPKNGNELNTIISMIEQDLVSTEENVA